MKDRNGNQINIGDTVEWVAEASGVKKPREGKVVERVSKGMAAKTPRIPRNPRSDRVVVCCEEQHSRGVAKKYFSPVLSRVTVVPTAQAPRSSMGVSDVPNNAAEIDAQQKNARSDGLRA